MAKSVQTRHVCRECGYETQKWLGKCPGCGEWGTLEETVTVAVAKTVVRAGVAGACRIVQHLAADENDCAA